MEVISKELHKNLLPILLIVFVMFSIIAAMSTTSGIILAKALVTQITHVEASKNGLAHVSFESSEETKPGTMPTQAGDSTNRFLILQSAAQDQNQ